MKPSKTIIKLIAFLVFLTGVLNIWSALHPPALARIKFLTEILPLEIANLGRLFSVYFGFALIILSSNLLKGKKAALWIAYFALLVNAFLQLTKGLDYEEGLVSLLVAALLFFLRKNFQAKPDRPSFVKGLKLILFSLIFALFYGLLGNLLSPVIGQHYRWFINSFYFVSLGIFFYSFLAFLSPIVMRYEVGEEDMEIVRNIYKNYATRSVDPASLLSGRKYFFFGSESYLAFKQQAGYVFVSGGPIGPQILRRRNVASFLYFCKRNALSPIFLNIADSELGIYRSLKLKFLRVGMEAVINLQEFSFEGKKKKPLRYSQSIMERLGYSVELLEKPINDKVYNELKIVSNSWLESKHGAEKKFFSPFSLEYLNTTQIMVMKNSQQKIEAFANFIEYGRKNIGIDLMRHQLDLPPDAMLYLFSELIIWAKNKGYNSLSLGVAPLFGVAEEADSPVSEKVLKLVFNHFNRLYNFKGLWVFKSKFMPDWQPKYLVFSSYPSLLGALPLLSKVSSDTSLKGDILVELKKGLRKLKTKGLLRDS